MSETIQRAYESAPKRWTYQLLLALLIAGILAWSSTTVELGSTGENGWKVAGNIRYLPPGRQASADLRH